jgi:hypothetical protein
MNTRNSDHPPDDVILVLDVDGVILDSERGGKGRWQSVLREKHAVDPSLLDEVFFQRAWSDVILGREPIEPALARALRELDWKIDVETVLSCWFEADFEVNHEVVRAVNGWTTAFGIRMALATNQEARRARFLEMRLGPLLPFAGIVFSGALGVLKNDTRLQSGGWASTPHATGSSLLMTRNRMWRLRDARAGRGSTSTSRVIGILRSTRRCAEELDGTGD